MFGTIRKNCSRPNQPEKAPGARHVMHDNDDAGNIIALRLSVSKDQAEDEPERGHPEGKKHAGEEYL